MKFQKESDLTDEWIEYIKNKSIDLSQKDDQTIEQFADLEFYNPEMRNFLDSWDGNKTLKNLASSSVSSTDLVADVMARRKRKFKELKDGILKAICDVVKEITDPENRLEEIIKLAVLACLGSLAGLPGVILSLIIVVIAKLLRKGIAKLCDS